jgi:sulfide:quinone oxidoreductase
MRRLLVLGAGTAGTMVVNKLRHKLGKHDWQITVVDQDASHLYQPGLLLLPFGAYTPEELVKRRQDVVPDGVELLI